MLQNMNIYQFVKENFYDAYTGNRINITTTEIFDVKDLPTIIVREHFKNENIMLENVLFIDSNSSLVLHNGDILNRSRVYVYVYVMESSFGIPRNAEILRILINYINNRKKGIFSALTYILSSQPLKHITEINDIIFEDKIHSIVETFKQTIKINEKLNHLDQMIIQKPLDHSDIISIDTSSTESNTESIIVESFTEIAEPQTSLGHEFMLESMIIPTQVGEKKELEKQLQEAEKIIQDQRIQIQKKDEALKQVQVVRDYFMKQYKEMKRMLNDLETQQMDESFVLI